MGTFKKVLKWLGIIVTVLFVGLVIYRMFVLNDEKKTAEQVAWIHAQKITIDDVMGVNLPPPPGENADKTIAGVDVNNNGIRDDVELAIFREYKDSAKKRAVALQYAHALQMEFTQPFLNTDVVVAVAKEVGRGSYCTTHIFSRANFDEFVKQNNTLVYFVEGKHINTVDRKTAQNKFYEKIDSYSSLSNYCDIDYSKLSN